MSGSSKAPEWVWSSKYNSKYYHDSRSHQYVLQNQRRVPDSTQMDAATPRNPLQTPNLGREQYPYAQSVPQDRAYVYSPEQPSGSGMQRPANTLSQEMAMMQITSGPITSTVEGYDEKTGVKSVVQSVDSLNFLDPALQHQTPPVRFHKHLLGTRSGPEEKLDPSFQIKPKKFFAVGRVLLTLWTEPNGNSTAITGYHRAKVTKGRFQEEMFSKIRRFVVIREGGQSCAALPILTYGGKGTAQMPVQQQAEHGIIYAGKTIPQRPRLETGLLPLPIRINADLKNDNLDDISRLNYGKVYTVEHNVKVKSFGMVDQASTPGLIDQFTKVWIHWVGERQQGNRGRASMNTRPDLTPGYHGPSNSQGNTGNSAPFTPAQEEAMRVHGRAAENRERAQALNPPSAALTPGDSKGLSKEENEMLKNGLQRPKAFYLQKGYDETVATEKARNETPAAIQKIISARGPSQPPLDRQTRNPDNSRDNVVTGSSSARSATQASQQSQFPRGLQLPLTGVNSSQPGQSQFPSTGRQPPTLDSLLAHGFQQTDALNIQKMVLKDGFTPNTALIVQRLIRNGTELRIATRLGRMVDAGWDPTNAMEFIRKEVASSGMQT